MHVFFCDHNLKLVVKYLHMKLYICFQMVSYHAKPLAVGPLVVLDALGKLTLKYNVQGSSRYDFVRFPFLRILQLFQFTGYLHIVNRSCALRELKCVFINPSLYDLSPIIFCCCYTRLIPNTPVRISFRPLKKSVCILCLPPLDS